MHNNRRPFALDQTKYAFPVANIDFVMLVSGDGLLQSPQRPESITFRTKCFPEMLDGRVKTIHPKIAGGIAVRGTPLRE